MKVGGAEWPRKAGGQIESEIWVQGRVRLWQSGRREGRRMNDWSLFVILYNGARVRGLVPRSDT